MLPKIARKTIGLADGSFSRISIMYHSLLFHGEGVTRPVQLPVTMLGVFTSDMLNNLFLAVQQRHRDIRGGADGKGQRGFVALNGDFDAIPLVQILPMVLDAFKR